MRHPGASFALGLLIAAAMAEAGAADHVPPPSPDRRATLVHIVRQDCGSCHGLTLKGGLGPALLPETLADKPVESLAATIIHGRPGTPMPPFLGIVSDAEAQWIVERLVAGFPKE